MTAHQSLTLTSKQRKRTLQQGKSRERWAWWVAWQPPTAGLQRSSFSQRTVETSAPRKPIERLLVARVIRRKRHGRISFASYSPFLVRYRMTGYGEGPYRGRFDGWLTFPFFGTHEIFEDTFSLSFSRSGSKSARRMVRLGCRTSQASQASQASKLWSAQLVFGGSNS